jgi:NADPH:quinone reductase-like Zn-dependent oxidoreductase
MLLSPINPSDLNFVHGTYYHALERMIWNQRRTESDSRVSYDPDGIATCPVPPYSLGGEGVGMVDAVGSGFLARHLRGKRVAVASGPPNGTWQEFAIVDARKAVSLPDDISDELGSMFFVNPLTAYVLVREVLKVPRGSWLLVTAAGSALGKSVVRLGKRYGYRTLCVVRSNSNSDELRSLGADAVVKTDDHDLLREVFDITQGKGVKSAIDCVGGELAGQVVRCLGMDGRLVIYGTLSNDPIQILGRDLMMPGAEVSGFFLPNWLGHQSPLKLLNLLREVKRLTRSGMFDTKVSATFPLQDVVPAVKAALQPGRTGKVLLRMNKA